MDRTVLVAAAAERGPAASARRDGASAVEQTLVALLNELLGVEAAVDDDFFALGGNSLVAVQLAARAQDVGIPLAAADVVQHPSVAALAATLPTGPGSA